MADQVFYFRTTEYTDFMGWMHSPSVVNPVTWLAEIDDAAFAEKVLPAIDAADFLGHSELCLVFQNATDDKKAHAIATLITKVDRARHRGEIEHVWQSIEHSFREVKEIKSDEGTPAQVTRAVDKLKQVIGKPALAGQRKAELVDDATGNQLTDLVLRCDLRPVFDNDRREVDGVVLRTTLRATIEGIDGLPIAVEAVLTDKQVEKLADESDRAKNKLERLKEYAKDKGMVLVRTR